MSKNKIKDGIAAEQAAYRNVSEDNIYDLYINGTTEVPIPEDIAVDEYIPEVIYYIESIWGEPEVNFPYEDVDFQTSVAGDILTINAVRK